MRQGDWRRFQVVRRSHFALLAAEELGVTRQSIDQFASSPNPDVRRFLGRTMVPENDWAGRIVAQVGNFCEL